MQQGHLSKQQLRHRRRMIRRRNMRRNWDVYLMALPGLAFLIVFSYLPIYGMLSRNNGSRTITSFSFCHSPFV